MSETRTFWVEWRCRDGDWPEGLAVRECDHDPTGEKPVSIRDNPDFGGWIDSSRIFRTVVKIDFDLGSGRVKSMEVFEGGLREDGEHNFFAILEGEEDVAYVGRRLPERVLERFATV